MEGVPRDHGTSNSPRQCPRLQSFLKITHFVSRESSQGQMRRGSTHSSTFAQRSSSYTPADSVMWVVSLTPVMICCNAVTCHRAKSEIRIYPSSPVMFPSTISAEKRTSAGKKMMSYRYFCPWFAELSRSLQTTTLSSPQGLGSPNKLAQATHAQR